MTLLSSCALIICCRQETDHFPLVVGMRWENQSSKTRVIDNDTTRTSDTLISSVKGRLFYDILGSVIELDEITGRDTMPRYYRKDSLGVRLLWLGLDERPDSAMILPARVDLGAGWLFSNRAGGAITCSIVRKEDVSVPAGAFRDCLRIDFEFLGHAGYAETRWYASGVGVVRDEFVREERIAGHVLRESGLTELISFRRGRR